MLGIVIAGEISSSLSLRAEGLSAAEGLRLNYEIFLTVLTVFSLCLHFHSIILSSIFYPEIYVFFSISLSG